MLFFKQKTAYELRISDWSSDVCSSDLGSETHTVTITAPEGFTIGDVVGSLPTGVSIQSASDTTVVLSVDSKDGDGQDGVGSFSATFEVTNVSAPKDRKSTRLNSSH